MNAQQAPRTTTPPARFRTVRRGLAAVALVVMLPLAALGQGAVAAHAAGGGGGKVTPSSIIHFGLGWVCITVWPFGEHCYEVDI
jgi:hypothetical protein